MAGAADAVAPRAARAAAAAGRPRGLALHAHALLLLLVAAAAASRAAPTPQPPSPTDATPPGALCDWPQCNCSTPGLTRVVARCYLERNQEVELRAGALPVWLLELHIEGGGGGGVRVAAAAFSAVRDLRLLNVTALGGALVLRRHAFLNLSSQHVNVHAADCAAVVFETQAFRSPAGPASVDVRRCGHVVVQSGAFAWLLRVRFSGVARLELASNAFALEQPDARRHGPAPSVVLERVMVAELPPLAFPSLMSEVRLSECHVRAVRRDAFYALQLSVVRVDNSSLQRVDGGAFSARTLVLQLAVHASRVGVVATGALLGAVMNLSITNSHVDEAETGAVNITVAKVTLADSAFGVVRERAFSFRDWNSVVVRGNTFRALHADAVWTPFQRVADVHTYELRWQDNRIADLRSGALSSLAAAAAAAKARGDAKGELHAEVRGLWLEGACRCDLEERLSGDAGLLVAASCAVDASLARCLGLREGRAAAVEYAARVCDRSERVLVCEASPAGGALGGVDALPPPSAAADADTDAPDRGKKVLTLVFAAVSLGSLAVLAASGALWLRRKGHCRRAGRWAPPASAASCLAQLARLWAPRRAPAPAPPAAGTNNAAGPANAAAATHYTELQRGDGAALAADADDLDEEAMGAGGADAEDKWTQTMPEELTQELLQALREKLDDPENYSEARDMIEHLYDLIKVEESCSNNNRPAGAGSAGSLADLVDADDNLYEAIRPRVRRARGDTCSVGTRAPSPDALEPALPPATPATTAAATPALARARAPLLCEYVEPRDRTQHLYAEVPGGAPLNLALPPHRISRPLSFLRSLGESLQAVLPTRGPAPSSPPPPPPPSAAASPGCRRAPASLAAAAAAASAAAAAQPTTSLLCEYTEPTDAQVHVYSELPPAMMNRPLPETPPSLPKPPHG